MYFNVSLSQMLLELLSAKLYGYEELVTFWCTRVRKNIGGNGLVTGNCLTLQTAICSSTLCIKSRGRVIFVQWHMQGYQLYYTKLS